MTAGMDRFTGKLLEGADHLAQSLGDILGTPRGTRVGRRSYGSDLSELLDQPMNGRTQLLVYAATTLAIQRQEKRVRLSKVALALGDAPGAFRLRLIGRRTDTPAVSPLDLTVSVRAGSALAA